MKLVEKKQWMVYTSVLGREPEEVVTYVDPDTSHVEFYKDWGGLTFSKDEWDNGEVFTETKEEAEQLRQTHLSDLKHRLPAIKSDLTRLYYLDTKDNLETLLGVTDLEDVLGPFESYVIRRRMFEALTEKHQKVCQMYDAYIKTGSLCLNGAYVKAADVAEVDFSGSPVRVETRYREFTITDEPTVEFLKHLYGDGGF